MTWDNIKIGFLKLWTESKDFQKLIIGLITWPIFTAYWVALFIMWYPEESTWKVILAAIATGLLSAVSLLLLLEVAAGIRYVIQKLNDIGQQEKDRVFNALKNGPVNDEDPELKEAIKNLKNRPPYANPTPRTNDRQVDELLNSFREKYKDSLKP